MAADHDHPGGYLLTIPAPRSSLRPRQASGLAGTVRLASQARIVKGGAVDPTRKRYRSKTDRKLAGVCGGLARYFNLDAMLIRVLFVVLAVLGGSGLGALAGDVDHRPTSRKPPASSWPRLGPGYGGLDQEPAGLGVAVAGAVRLIPLANGFKMARARVRRDRLGIGGPVASRGGRSPMWSVTDEERWPRRPQVSATSSGSKDWITRLSS